MYHSLQTLLGQILGYIQSLFDVLFYRYNERRKQISWRNNEDLPSDDRWLTSKDMLKMTPSNRRFYCECRDLPFEESETVVADPRAQDNDDNAGDQYVQDKPVVRCCSNAPGEM